MHPNVTTKVTERLAKPWHELAAGRRRAAFHNLVAMPTTWSVGGTYLLRGWLASLVEWQPDLHNKNTYTFRQLFVI